MKIGLGLITCKRKESFIKAFQSLSNCSLDEIVVINDDSNSLREDIVKLSNKNISTINNNKILGVSKSKNKALNFLLEKKCDYIFLQEDDVFIKNKNVFEKYINLHEETGIDHFNFALQNNKNLSSESIPNPRLSINYHNTSLSLYSHHSSAFSFYTKNILEKTGLIDERFGNALGELDLTYRICMRNFHPPFWWFADIYNSQNFLEKTFLDTNFSKTSKADYAENFLTSLGYFRSKHKIDLYGVKNPDKHYVVSFLKKMKT